MDFLFVEVPESSQTPSNPFRLLGGSPVLSGGTGDATIDGFYEPTSVLYPYVLPVVVGFVEGVDRGMDSILPIVDGTFTFGRHIKQFVDVCFPLTG